MYSELRRDSEIDIPFNSKINVQQSFQDLLCIQGTIKRMIYRGTMYTSIISVYSKSWSKRIGTTAARPKYSQKARVLRDKEEEAARVLRDEEQEAARVRDEEAEAARVRDEENGQQDKGNGKKKTGGRKRKAEDQLVPEEVATTSRPSRVRKKPEDARREHREKVLAEIRAAGKPGWKYELVPPPKAPGKSKRSRNLKIQSGSTTKNLREPKRACSIEARVGHKQKLSADIPKSLGLDSNRRAPHLGAAMPQHEMPYLNSAVDADLFETIGAESMEEPRRGWLMYPIMARACLDAKEMTKAKSNQDAQLRCRISLSQPDALTWEARTSLVRCRMNERSTRRTFEPRRLALAVGIETSGILFKEKKPTHFSTSVLIRTGEFYVRWSNAPRRASATKSIQIGLLYMWAEKTITCFPTRLALSRTCEVHGNHYSPDRRCKRNNSLPGTAR
ncbi:hypothetical protein C8R47DRAFT_1079562 [Mycena vitilis]|nr:hypothetical protein C8R47DRAFT_1079562 [Mycena vitilis]